MLPKTRALARESGRKSIVLLKNDGDLLPLPRSGKTIALIGPFAAGSTTSSDRGWSSNTRF